MHDEMDQIHPPAGLVDSLTEIHESGRYLMDILTSNRRKNVFCFLAQHQINWFDEVESTHAILSKKRRVEKYIRHKGLNPDMLYYIGDTTVDVESARLRTHELRSQIETDRIASRSLQVEIETTRKLVEQDVIDGFVSAVGQRVRGNAAHYLAEEVFDEYAYDGYESDEDGYDEYEDVEDGFDWYDEGNYDDVYDEYESDEDVDDGFSDYYGGEGVFSIH